MEKTTLVFVKLAFLFGLAQGFLETFENSAVDTCSVEKRSCEIHNNLIDTINGIQVEECRQLCFDSTYCKYFSHFGPNNYPISNYCMLFSTCSVLENCEDCYTEDKLCYGSCGRNLESKFDENVIEFVPDIVLEHSCKTLCLENTDCFYYTHYGKDNDHYPELCVLLSDIKGPFQECEHCVTSVPDCKDSSYACKFTINNENTFYYSYMFTSYGNTVKFPLASNLACQATFVAIGSGGSSSSGYGGGSGYISNVLVNVSSTEYEVTVGRQYEYNDGDSFINSKEGATIIKANGGRNAYYGGGGNGYSGGGGHGKGGSNGMNGEGENGGSGSGTNISEIFLDHFVLSPGDGGEPYVNGAGGGGGGILVDNFGPDSDDSCGKGYGGGDGGGGNGYGLLGMVLIEVDTKN